MMVPMTSRHAAAQPPAGARPLSLAGYAGLAGFFALEAMVRRGGPAASLKATADDEGSTQRIVVASAIAGLAAPVVRRLPAPAMPRSAARAGIAAQVLGIGLRAWSMRVLGASYSRTLHVESTPAVIDDGPYAVVRHPGYLGSLMIWLGFALTSRSPLVVALVAAVVGDAYRRRIVAEERMLERDLPDYAAYARRTARLIPYVW